MLVGLAGLALWLLPSFIPVDTYRERIATEVANATGQELQINGAVSVTLLPSPSVILEDVSLRNHTAGLSEHIISAKKIAIEAALMPLLSGTLKISGVSLDSPLLNLEILPNGAPNWEIFTTHSPSDGSQPTGTNNKKRLTISNVQIHDGMVRFRNMQTDEHYELQQLSLSLRMSSLQGPFQLNGTGNYRDMALAMQLAAGQLSNESNVPLEFSLSAALSSLHYKGEMSAANDFQTNGTLSFDAKDLPGLLSAIQLNSDASALPKDITLQSKLHYSMQKASLSPLTLTMDGNPSEGEATADFSGSKPRFDIALKGKMLALHEPTTNNAKMTSPTNLNQEMNLSSTKGSALPQDFSIGLDLNFDTLSYRNEEAKKLAIKAELADGQLVVHQASAILPGDAQISFFGVAGSETGESLFEGKLESRGKNLRTLLQWIGVSLPDIPKGSLGAFQVSSNVLFSPSEIRFTGGQFRLDDSAASGAAILVLAKDATQPLPKLDATLRINKLDANRYQPNKKSAPVAQASTDSTLSNNVPVLPVSWLKNLGMNMNIATRIDTFTWDKETFSNVFTHLKLKPGKLTAEQFSTVYKGAKLSGKGTLDATPSKPVIDVTLNADTLDTTPFLSAPPANAPAVKATAADGNVWSKERINLDALAMVNGTINATAKSVKHQNFLFTDINFSGAIKDSLLRVTKFDAKAFDGTVSANGDIVGGNIPSAAISMSLAGLRTEQLLQFLADIADRNSVRKPFLLKDPAKWIHGTTNLNGSFHTSGVSPNSWVSQLQSSASLALIDTVIEGFDLKALALRITNVRSVSDVINLARLAQEGGKTKLRSIQAPFYIRDGIVQLPKGTIETDVATGEMKGTIRLQDWMMNSLVTFNILAGKGKSLPPLGVQVTGRMQEPKIALDTKPLEAYVAKRAAEHLIKQFSQ